MTTGLCPTRTIGDAWTIVAEFCDINARGRLYSTIKYIFINWNTLIVHHLKKNAELYIFKGCLEGDWRCMESHCLLKGYTMPYRTLSLPSGKQVSCWSPLCAPGSIQINDSHIRVFFDLCNKEHAHFMGWLQSLYSGAKSHVMCAHTPRRKNIRMWGVDGHYELKKLPHEFFRVKLYIHVRLSGYPTLDIQYFELKKRK